VHKQLRKGRIISCQVQVTEGNVNGGEQGNSVGEDENGIVQIVA
jgi:hypothetical protein